MLFSITAGLNLTAYAAGNSISTATSISLSKTYSGSITSTNEADFYKFTIPSSGKIVINYSGQILTEVLKITDGNGNVLHDDYYYWDDSIQLLNVRLEYDLTGGTYYFSVHKRNDYTENYKFSINCVHKYTDEITKVPTCTSTGEKNILVHCVDIHTVKRLKRLRIHIQIQFQKQHLRQMDKSFQYATKSDFSNAISPMYAGATATTSKTITGRGANTKYYVRVRSYKNVNGTYLYGSWSAAKAVTTKK